MYTVPATFCTLITTAANLSLAGTGAADGAADAEETALAVRSGGGSVIGDPEGAGASAGGGGEAQAVRRTSRGSVGLYIG
jgi:hypothetical protein